MRAAGLDTEVGFRKSPYATVPLYGQVEAYPAAVVENYITACTQRGDARMCRCTIDAIRRRFTVEEYQAMEARIRAGEVPRELLAALEDCRP